LIAVFSSYLTLVVINYIYYFIYGSFVFVSVTLLITSILSFFGLFIFRIFVKIAFELLNRNQDVTMQNSIMVGVNSTTIALAEAFIQDPSSPYRLLFFVDKNKLLHGKKILGIPIISKHSKIETILRFHKIRNVILLKNFLDEKEELDLIESCLRNKIQIFFPKLESGSIQSSAPLKKYTLDDLLFRNLIEINNPKVGDEFKDKVVLVTGGAGSIGSEIVHQLMKLLPQKVVVMDQAESPMHELQLKIKATFPQMNCIFELADVRNSEEVQIVFERHAPQIVFHAAAYKHVPLLERNFYQAIKINVFGTKNVLDIALTHKVERFVFVSTDKAVNPTNIMGASKRIAEIVAQATYFQHKTSNSDFNTEIIITRFGNVLGSNGSVVNLFEKQIKKGGPITVTHPEINRYFMTIPEACRLVLEAATMGRGGEIYLFDMGKPIKIVDLAEKMIRLHGKEPYTDIDIVFTGLREGEKLYEELLADKAKTIPTYNPKIMIATDQTYQYSVVEAFLQEVYLCHNMNDKREFISVLKKLVPEYILEVQE
jgi:FlaA1/EpsC-like NDP-sugar epimerase